MHCERDNAIVSGRLPGFRRRQVEARLDEIIAFAELEEVIDYPLHTYSTGMRARLWFSVAAQPEPDILLIDKMLGVGDSEFQRKSRGALAHKLTADKSVVLVSHDAESIRELTSRVLWIERGESIAEGDPGEILCAYETYSELDAEVQIGFLNCCKKLRKENSADDPAVLLRKVFKALGVTVQDSHAEAAGPTGPGQQQGPGRRLNFRIVRDQRLICLLRRVRIHEQGIQRPIH